MISGRTLIARSAPLLACLGLLGIWQAAALILNNDSFPPAIVTSRVSGSARRWSISAKCRAFSIRSWPPRASPLGQYARAIVSFTTATSGAWAACARAWRNW